MASSTFFIPSVNVIGADSLTDAMNMMADYGFTRTLIVTDSMLTKLGMAGDVQKALEERNIFSVIYDGTQPNPTTENVAAGLKLLLNLQSKCNKKRSTHQLEYNFVSTQKPFPNDEY
ncbi:iron-containing alcohol dehydrogenase, partial [Escherichia coli]|uniref:iron-containing alcohol dehydrogenase n=1 Tax=Escherichia coli TaxID=562 RepID=UPI002077163A